MRILDSRGDLFAGRPKVSLVAIYNGAGNQKGRTFSGLMNLMARVRTRHCSYGSV